MSNNLQSSLSFGKTENIMTQNINKPKQKCFKVGGLFAGIGGIEKNMFIYHLEIVSKFGFYINVK